MTQFWSVVTIKTKLNPFLNHVPLVTEIISHKISQNNIFTQKTHDRLKASVRGVCFSFKDLLYQKLKIFYKDTNYSRTLWGFTSLCSLTRFRIRIQTLNKKTTAAHLYPELHPVFSLETLFYLAQCMLKRAITGSVELSAIYKWTQIFKLLCRLPLHGSQPQKLPVF